MNLHLVTILSNFMSGFVGYRLCKVELQCFQEV